MIDLDRIQELLNKSPGARLAHQETLLDAVPALVKELKAVQRDLDAMCSAHKAIDAEAEALRHDVDYRKEVMQERALRIEHLEADAERLRLALEKYGQHDDHCRYISIYGPPAACDCGFAEVEETLLLKSGVPEAERSRRK
jgi:uncharacterized protein (DUF3084 family)